MESTYQGNDTRVAMGGAWMVGAGLLCSALVLFGVSARHQWKAPVPPRLVPTRLMTALTAPLVPATGTPKKGPRACTLDSAWYLKGGMITGGFVPPAAQEDWPLWMQALILGKADVSVRELGEADLYKIPDVFLVRAVQVLVANRIFAPRLLRQATAIGYTADAAAWEDAKTAYQVAYVQAQGLPVKDAQTTSRLLTQLARRRELALVRSALKSTAYPEVDPALHASFQRLMDFQEGLATPTREVVLDRRRPASERLWALNVQKRPGDVGPLLAGFKGTDCLDLAVYHAVAKEWIPIDSPWVDEAIQVRKKPDDATPWFLVRPEERVSDLLWMRVMDALNNNNRKTAILLAHRILEWYPDSWFAGHGSYLLTALDRTYKAPQQPPLRVPGDVTFFNAGLLQAHLTAPVQQWSEPLRELAKRNRFDLILAQSDPGKEPDAFLRAAFFAGQQDLVARFEACERRCEPDTTPYLYPVFLAPVVKRLIREEGLEGLVDEAFVMAMIKNESVFQPTARSGSEAFGIMQLLKPTFTHMVGKGADILDPETNIRAGLRYYRTVIRTAQLESMPQETRMLYVLAGYHAGEGRAKRWSQANESKLQGRATPIDMLLRIDSVPITTTRMYITRALGDREIFKAFQGVP